MFQFENSEFKKDLPSVLVRDFNVYLLKLLNGKQQYYFSVCFTYNDLLSSVMTNLKVIMHQVLFPPSFFSA